MNTEKLRVAIADDDVAERHEIKDMLETLGHDVVAEAPNGEQLVAQVAENKPDVVIADFHMPVMDGLQAAEKLALNGATPVVMTTSSHSPVHVRSALERENVVGYLVKPFAAAALDGAMRLAYGLFHRFRGLHERLASFQRSQTDRKAIEQAKEILMNRLKISEPEAHRRLQKMASSRNQKLVELATTIVVEATEKNE